jgi:hydroxymethylbilane synthase
MTASLLRIGSRASPLARAQAEWVAERLTCPTALVWVRSGGDEDRTRELTAFGATGIFTAALHEALHADRIDVAVHSLKDLPAIEEAGVALACVPAREDPRDVLIARDAMTLADLPAGARVGTGSPRRVAQLRALRRDLVFEGVRGNIDTRIRQVAQGRLDAVVLALAGLRRTGREAVATEVFDVERCVPAAGQGALGITIRQGDARAEECLGPLRDVRAAACTAAERAALHALGAGCHAPVGAHAVVRDGRVHLHVRVSAPDAPHAVERRAEGSLGEAHALGQRVGRALLDEDGAGPLVAAP